VYAKNRAVLRLIGAVPAPGNVEPEPDPAAMPPPSAFDGGVRGTPALPPKDEAQIGREHGELLVESIHARRGAGGMFGGGFTFG
jgi:hypothetical protein